MFDNKVGKISIFIVDSGSVRGKFSKITSNDVLWMGKCLRISVYKRQKFRKIIPAKVGWRQSFLRKSEESRPP